jgi:hypothetical protein
MDGLGLKWLHHIAIRFRGLHFIQGS